MAYLDDRIDRFFLSPYFLFGTALICFFLGLGSVPLFDLDEGAFTEATREMFESGVFSATYLDGEPRYDKPILFYWFQAASIKLFGFNEWAYRLPSALAACAWAWAIFSFVKQYFTLEKAYTAAAFMMSCLWVGVIARSAIADALLNLFLSLAMFDIWRHIHSKRELPLFRAYFWMGMGTLTKGPVAVVVPVAVSFLFLLSAKQLKEDFKAYFYFKGWAVYFAVVTPWLIAVWMTQGMGFFEGFLGEHNINRFTSTRESHGGSPLYYFGALPLILLPVSGMLFPTLYKVKAIWKSELCRYLSLWFIVIFILFSFSKTQLPHYILNCCVPLFILLSAIPNTHEKHRWTVVFGLVILTLLVFLPELLSIAAEQSKGYDGALLSRHEESMTPWYRIFAISLLGLALFASFLPKLKTWQRLTVIGLALNILVFNQVVRIASSLQQAPIHSLISYFDEHHAGKEVVAYRMHMPTFSVYRERITPLRTPDVGELAIVRVDRVDSLRERIHPNKVIELHKVGGLVAVQIEGRHE